MSGGRWKPYLWLISATGLLVPRRLRAGWRREWEAELAHREALLERWRKPRLRSGLGLLRRSLGSFMDALSLQPRRLEEDMFQDLRYGARMFARKPGFTAVAVLTLALGVGANTTIFSVVNGVLLHPLPYKDSERIMRIMVSNQQRGIADGPVSYLRYEDLRDRSRSFEKTAAFAFDNFNLTGQEQPEQLQGVRASASLFEVLGVNPARGRLFLPEEDRPGGERVVLVSYGLWQRRFGGDPNLVGRTLTLDGSSYAVVGIMPRGFSFPATGVEVWTTKVFETSRLTPDQVRKGAGYVTLVARLKPGVERESAESEMRVISQQYQQQNPTLTDADPNATVDVLPLREQLVRNVRSSL
ncbi:MAG TPA: ABC transporter permease, partial [Pyrinomonadaceae bacterium]|nr:ABC transporter permease [Pyrinomonadaceae bacterium]